MQKGMQILLTSFLAGISSCGENTEAKYELDGTQWKVSKYNGQNVTMNEYIRFNGDRMRIWYNNGNCYEEEKMNLNVDNGALYAFVDDLDKTVQLHYSIEGNILTIDFSAYEIQYVSSEFDPSSFERCN